MVSDKGKKNFKCLKTNIEKKSTKSNITVFPFNKRKKGNPSAIKKAKAFG
jgi:hypothetical protein